MSATLECLSLISLKSSDKRGTGKSVLIREIIRWAVRVHRIIFVTASTGMAAVNINGMTLHSWSGCGLCKRPVSTYVARIRKGENGSERWMRTQILMVDESRYQISPYFSYWLTGHKFL